jgi:hypothetical protein
MKGLKMILVYKHKQKKLENEKNIIIVNLQKFRASG